MGRGEQGIQVASTKWEQKRSNLLNVLYEETEAQSMPFLSLGSKVSYH